MGARYFALISGIIYLLIGIFGFVPGMVATPGTGGPEVVLNEGYGYLLNLFPINVLHNIVHLAVGAWGLFAYRSYIQARTYSRGLAIFYGILAVMGLLPVLNTVFGLIPIFGHNVWLHALTAAIAAYFGFKTPTPADIREHEREVVTGRSRGRF
ncbi:DUF4383 domain-containing protein [Leptolyngbya sp. NK1-12]|uniref:DUF4383 domain-containing protein n=1 Tax=Leptolyngbya sp. NK1-12 TaxID=2547451 RepID=A0AA97ALR6_9CYAN|nr:DUF4383 domain-containing protein [Leptolyngbya sp. NK1-12]MBF2050604.1 DUF4383 domain-containing protein [Elainella sp. C42_A2020_010]RNJ65618.1 MAG: DUF4383 domain-containing protein [Leptolyngbya sp. IPPAS B-1204]WNZ27826.1 DUF4383 domain-containing protein [Leptolyngbya sp. NK1-12]